MMLINRVRKPRRTETLMGRVASLSGLGSPDFFIDASGVNFGDLTWTDSAGGKVGTFDNSSVVLTPVNGGRAVRLTGARCLFPDDVLSMTDTHLVCLASVRPLEGAPSVMHIVSQPRDSAGNYSWRVDYTNFGSRISPFILYQNLQIYNPTFTRPVPGPYSFGLITLAIGNYAASDHIDTGTLQSYLHTRYAAQSITLAGTIRPGPTTAMNFLVGGGRASNGTASNLFYGDIEWLGLWKVPCSSLLLNRFSYSYISGTVAAKPSTPPPKKAPPKSVYVDPLFSSLPAYPSTKVVYSASAPIGTYNTGDVVDFTDGTVGECVGNAVPVSNGIPSNEWYPLATAQLYVTRNRMYRLVDSTPVRPLTAIGGARKYLKSGDTLRLGVAYLRKQLISTSVIDGHIGIKPNTAYSKLFTDPKHLSPFTLYVRPYNAGSVVGKDTLGYSLGGLRIANAVVDIRDLYFLTRTSNGCIELDNADASVRGVTVLGDIWVIRSRLEARELTVPTMYGGRPPSFLNMNDPLDTIRSLQLIYGHMAPSAAISARGGYAAVASSTHLALAFFIAATHSKVRCAHMVMDSGFLHARPAITGRKFFPVADTEAPGDITVEWYGGSIRDNAFPCIGSPGQTAGNQRRYYAVGGLKSIANDSQIAGAVSSFRSSGGEYSATYKADTDTFPSRNPVSFGTAIDPIAGSLSRAESPLRTRNFVEVFVDILSPGTVTLEIDFMVQTTNASLLTSPAGFMSVAAFFYDISGVFRVYRDPVSRSGVARLFSSAYTLTQKTTSTAWVGAASGSHISGSRTVTLEDVSEGTLRLQVFTGVSGDYVFIDPTVKVT